MLEAVMVKEMMEGTGSECNVRLCHDVIIYLFFFQAEDGIRDYKVTGVQTCALPISRTGLRSGFERLLAEQIRLPHARDRTAGGHPARRHARHRPPAQPRRGAEESHGEIGRASCRERV